MGIDQFRDCISFWLVVYCWLWNFGYWRFLLLRDAMLTAVYATPIPSVCLSVRLSHACIVSKGLNVSSKFFRLLIGPSF